MPYFEGAGKCSILPLMALTVPEAARRTGYAAETIRRWIRSGKLRARKVGTQHLIDEADLRSLPARAAEAAPPYGTVAYEPETDPALLARIVADPEVLVGKPRIAGTRISVELVLDLFAAGATAGEILDDYPHLAADDVRACLAYAAARVREERVVTTADAAPR